MYKNTHVLAERFNDAKTLINTRYSIPKYLEGKGIFVENNRQVRCPLHDDSTPSFSVSTDKNIWKCFGCPDGGHYLDLFIKYENRYNNKQFTPYLAVERLVQNDKELQAALGFSTIYADDTAETNLFTGEDTLQSFIQFLETKPAVNYVSTMSLRKVMDKLRHEDIDKVIEFIADCENGMTEKQLIAKWLNCQTSLESFIASLADKENDEDFTNAFREILDEDI